MKSTILRYSLLISLASLTLLNSCKKDEDDNQPAVTTGSVSFELTHKVGSDPLVQNTVNYVNLHGDTFTVTKFRYYISNIVLKRSDGTTYAPSECYYLIDDSVASSKTFTLSNVPVGEYTSMTFMLGVDSMRNCSGAQSGALDPLNGMFWSWNSGYIFMKLEGMSSASGSGMLMFHVGGFKGTSNAIRTIAPSLNGDVVNVRGGKSSTVHMIADVAEMFANPTTIDFSTLNMIHMPGPDAVTLADNYTDMFRVDHIHND
jgi:hypothetical protein